MEHLLNKFHQGLSEVGVDREADEAFRIIVAFSGGADSTLLLHITVKFFENTSVLVEAAHLNHMIRGSEADRDEAFCRGLAEELGIKLHVKRVDIPALVENGGGSVEEVARRERYAFFEELIAQSEVKTYVATAHNADDNLETVLFNISRGTALRGLCGIPPIRDGKFIRPMLSFSGEEIRSACVGLNLSYVNDSTNFETEYTRNYLRAAVVPPFEKLSPMLRARVQKMCASLRRDDDFFAVETKRFLEGVDVCQGIENKKLTDLHDALLSRVIPEMYKSVAGDQAPSLESVHINSVISALRHKNISFSITVPWGVSFMSDGTRSRFVLKRGNEDAQVDKSTVEVPFDTVITKNGYNILLSRDLNKIKRYSDENIYNLSIYKAVDFDKIKGSLKIRTRTAGDTYRFGGMTRKVKKLFSERRLAPEERETLPLIFDNEGIVWIPGFPLRDGLVPTERSSAVYCLVFK